MPSPSGTLRLRALVSGASEKTARDLWPEPYRRLLNDDRPPAPSLEDDALPRGWESWIRAEAKARACPPDYVAAGLICAASAWIGNARRVAPTPTWSEPLNLWFALVGAPSSGKTPALRSLIEATQMLERTAEPAWRDAVAIYERDAEAADATDRLWRDEVRAAAKEGKNAPDRPPGAAPPKKPTMPRTLAINITTEKLQRLLAENPRGLFYFRDELTGWLGGFDRYGGNGDDRAFFLETWNAAPYVCDRVKDETPVRIEHTLLSIVGGMVPDRLCEVVAAADDGLVERLILVWPEPTPIAPLSRGGAADAEARHLQLQSTADKLHALPMGTDLKGRPSPIALRLDDDAFCLFDEQQQQAKLQARSAWGLASGWHGKNPGRILRVAATFEHLSWAASRNGEPTPTNVSANSIARAVRYIRYASDMLERVLGGLAVGRADRDAAQIARHIAAAGPCASLNPLNERDLYQKRGFAWARDARRRAAALAVLKDVGWLRAAEADGRGRPRGDWSVNPRIWEGIRFAEPYGEVSELPMAVRNVQNVQSSLHTAPSEHFEQIEHRSNLPLSASGVQIEGLEGRRDEQWASGNCQVQQLDGVIQHFCLECGRIAAFGYGVCLKAGRLGRWYCGEHRPR
jgi:Protein of unknown function (DUF3987)